MKKKLLLSLTAVATAISVHAQTNVQAGKKAMQVKGHETGTPKMITGSLTCHTQFVAGSTMDLNFTLDLTNTDLEYCDLFTLTFPTGIVPNSSPNDPFSDDSADPGPDGPEALNPIVGQVISWGNDDNSFGGIITGESHDFTVNVTIDPSVNTNLSLPFLASGDGFANPGNLTGSITLYPVGATIIDCGVSDVYPTELEAYQNCGIGTMTISAWVQNYSNIEVSNIPVNYSVNGGTTVTETVPGPIAAGDSVEYIFTATYDFSAQNLYNLVSWTTITDDGVMANDQMTITFTNSLPIDLTTTDYINGFESDYDYASANMDWIGPGTDFSISNVTVHSGTNAVYMTLNTSFAPADDYESHAVLPCMNVEDGETYRISYFRKVNDNPAANGMSGIFYGYAQTADDMSNIIKDYTDITPNAAAGPWEKDSADFVANATETIYFSIGGKGTASTASQVNVRLDDIKIERISGVGIAEKSIVNRAYPNPVSEVLTIELNTMATKVVIIGMDGKVLSSKEVNSKSINLDLANLNAGIYFYEVISENGTAARSTFVKK